MELNAWATLGIVAAVLIVLATTKLGTDLVLLGALTLLLVTGILPAREALSGFANEGILTIGVLYIVVAGLRDTGVTAWVAQTFFRQPRSIGAAQARIMLPVAVLSAWMNNTPLVAMMLPIILDWSKRFRLAASKLLIPLSYAAILGGLCTLIGTSTNLIVNGLLIESTPTHQGMGMFEISKLGVPCAVAGVAFMLLVGRRLLPERRTPDSVLEDPREYSLEMIVEPDSALVGKTIEEAGLRHLPGLYLLEIERGNEILPAVSPHERLHGNDRLVFVGVVESVVDLQKIRGLKPATDQVFKLDAPRSDRVLIEAVISHSCPNVGRTIREGRFRTQYDAAVIAVARSGERIRKKIGDIVLEPGDTLLLEAHPDFVERHRNSRDFYLVSRLDDSTPPRHEHAWLSLLIVGGMVAAAATDLLPVLEASLLAAGLMLVTRCCSAETARRAVDWRLLVAIAASFALGKALTQTGAAKEVAGALLSLGSRDPWVTLALVYGLTMVFTELVTNNAAAVLMFPIAMAAAGTLGVSHWPFAMAIAVAASCGFATPLGYQTHLMVYGPGGYKFGDFLRIGIPLNLLIWAVTVALAPLLWPFRPQ